MYMYMYMYVVIAVRSTCTCACMQLSSSASSETADGGYECDLFPAGSRVDVWWPGDRAWYEADVIETRTEPHKIKGSRVLAREIFCRYLLDGVEKWHSLHNNRVRARTMMAERDVFHRDSGAQRPDMPVDTS